MTTNNSINSIREYLEVCSKQPSMQFQHLGGVGANYFLEEKLCAYYNKKHTVLFCNATTALQTLCIVLEMFNVDILTSPINWGGSISPFLLHKNKLSFTSIDTESLNLSHSDLSNGITSKTKAVLSVDFNGIPANSEAIKSFCSQNNLYYISDSAQSMGSFLKGKPAGYFADAIVLSFSPGKSFFGGEGGAIITDDDTIFERILLCSQHPSKQKSVLGISHFNEYSPINGRMNPLTAILLNESFDTYLENIKEYQLKCFEILTLLQIESLIEPVPHIINPSSSSFYNFSLQLKPSTTIDQLNGFLRDHSHSFLAFPTYPKLIPFDPLFRKQFVGKYNYTNTLLHQKGSINLNNRIKMVYSKTNESIL